MGNQEPEALAATAEGRCADAGHAPDRCGVRLVGGRCVSGYDRATSNTDDNHNGVHSCPCRTGDHSDAGHDAASHNDDCCGVDGR